ncbi:HlyD family efflux transporter periplasmic adaptor subunit [Sphaerisporangium sp. TRM90804]|uniref:efflux RND transporter periplasmic adaptor subunit n=1 Tax=Sphaerisporangium sp. TRM90804 TaxID=3031113 RepID=UPI002447061F|nr:HlyD family efflux transporter periplasmic adaptor subunit [Sphaerisporangium sp. TRM90804]MDH2426771.1 HlyD family efflux transporter periplasmic adaptor subunit [Sphaerisporangium sp. TRM90804]
MTIRRGIPPLLLGLTLLLASCTGDETPAVQIVAAGRAPVSEVVEAPATVGARATATLRSPAAGTVTKLYVRDGDSVDKGQILARIGSPQAKEQLKQARKAQKQASRPVRLGGAVAAPSIRLAGLSPASSLDRKAARGFADARSAARKVGDRRVRQRLLAAIDSAAARHRAQRAELNKITQSLTRSLNQVLAQVTGQIGAGLGGLASSMSSLQAASATQAGVAVRAAESTVDGLVIKAPFDGIVTLGGPAGGAAPGLGALLGGLPAGLAGQAGAATGPSGAGAPTSTGPIATGVPVAAGDAVVTVTDVSELTLSADVDETDVLLVTRGVKAEAEIDAVTGASYRARVTGVGVTPKEGTTGGVSYPVRLTLGDGLYDDGGEAPVPKPGMSAVVRLTVRESPDAVAVPASSGAETVVWVVRRDGTAERRVIRLGAQGDAAVEVTRGLSVGERVVVKGADTVRPGQNLTG